jgi:hypothetical protein
MMPTTNRLGNPHSIRRIRGALAAIFFRRGIDPRPHALSEQTNNIPSKEEFT